MSICSARYLGVDVLVGNLGQIPSKFPSSTKTLCYFIPQKKKTLSILLLSNCKILSPPKVIIQDKRTKKLLNILASLVAHLSHHKDHAYHKPGIILKILYDLF